jgi:tetratricopeptide (TPR) repeat protein
MALGDMDDLEAAWAQFQLGGGREEDEFAIRMLGDRREDGGEEGEPLFLRPLVQRYPRTENASFGETTADDVVADAQARFDRGDLVGCADVLREMLVDSGGGGENPAKDARLARDTRATAWQLLGETHLDLDEDSLAIRAFGEAAKLRDEAHGKESEQSTGEGGYPTVTWLLIAQAMLNEMHPDAAVLQALTRWLCANSPADLVPGDLVAELVEGEDPQHLTGFIPFQGAEGADFATLVEGLENAGERMREGNLAGAEEIPLALGLACTAMNDREGATQHFKRDAEVRGGCRAWNRVGATLANNGDYEGAIVCYRRALDDHPMFGKALHNIGVALYSQQEFDEALPFFVAALDLRESQKRETSELWQQTSLVMLQHKDFTDGKGAEICDARDLEGLKALVEPRFGFRQSSVKAATKN